jgi:ribulose-bisphosphate carboxylase large chain
MQERADERLDDEQGEAEAGARDRLRVTYEVTAGDAAGAEVRVAAIAREQTVEIPPGIVDAAFEARVVGAVGVARASSAASAGGGRRWLVTVAYDPALAGLVAAAPPAVDLPQLLNVLFGNVSMWQGVRVVDVDWPPSVLAALPGPRHGLAGLRALCGVPRRPLLCGALKPLGLPVEELAALAARAAGAGVDLVKDDHGLADQPAAPWAERVSRCQEVVTAAAARAGTRTLYVPNLSGPVETLAGRLERLRVLGVRVAMVAPGLIGFDLVRALAAGAFGPVPLLLGHPSLSGVFLGVDHGLAAEVLWGDLFRLAGCDAVIYPNAGGRFPIDLETAAAVHRRLRRPLGAVRPAMPCLGGGVQPDVIADWVERYGADTTFLVGGGIYRDPAPPAAARRIRDVLERWA